MRFRRSTRLRGFDYLGCYRYFVTLCVERRVAVFTAAEAVELVRGELLRTSVRSGFAVIAYCFMPDHLHFLIEGRDDTADFRAFMREFKQRSAFGWKRTHAAVLWERGYFDHVLRDDEDTSEVARYIVANPVRAGMVDDPAAYPFSGSAVLGMRDLLESLRI